MVDLTLSGQQRKAEELVRAGELEAAGRLCQRILACYPKYIGAYSVLAQVCLQAGEHDMAENLFLRVLGADPERASPYASLGAIYEERGLRDEAIWQLERATELSPTNEAMRAALYDLYDQCDAAYRADMGMTRATLARTYLHGGLYAKAIGELREIVADKPYRFDLRVALAEALWLDRRREEAETICEGLLKELPYCLKPNLILGQIRFNTEADDEARAMLQKAQALDPENRVAQALLGPDSPLPLRKARLPFGEENASWDPPFYLLESEEEAEPLTIEGSAWQLPTREEADILRLLEGVSVRELDGEGEPEEEVPEKEAVLVGLSWVSEGRKYLAKHPGDDAARLDLARKLGSMDRIDEALDQYGQLLQQDDEALLLHVIEDLTLLNSWHSGHQALMTMLSEARRRLENLEPSE